MVSWFFMVNVGKSYQSHWILSEKRSMLTYQHVDVSENTLEMRWGWGSCAPVNSTEREIKGAKLCKKYGEGPPQKGPGFFGGNHFLRWMPAGVHTLWCFCLWISKYPWVCFVLLFFFHGFYPNSKTHWTTMWKILCIFFPGTFSKSKYLDNDFDDVFMSTLTLIEDLKWSNLDYTISVFFFKTLGIQSPSENGNGT